MIKINLLPYRDERKKETLMQLGVIAAAPIVLVLLVFGFLWFFNNSQLSSAEDEITDLNRKISDCKVKMKEIETYKKKKKTLQKKMNVIKKLQGGKEGPVHMLDELATSIPGNIWLTSIKQKGMTLELEGRAIDNIAISNYMINLENSPYFSLVDLKTIVDQKTSKFKTNLVLKKFIITCKLTFSPKKTG